MTNISRFDGKVSSQWELRSPKVWRYLNLDDDDDERDGGTQHAREIARTFSVDWCVIFFVRHRRLVWLVVVSWPAATVLLRHGSTSPTWRRKARSSSGGRAPVSASSDLLLLPLISCSILLLFPFLPKHRRLSLFWH